ncbi:MAG: flavodoxin [Asgard group archaeon]|nr:flavodoxin [Asgard group archaeon]
MKTAVIYYSFEGDTELIAKVIAEEIGADLIPLEPVNVIESKEYMKNVIADKQVRLKTKPLLKEYEFDANDYDLLIFGTPIWSSTFAPALRTFFSQEVITDKKIGLFYCFTVKPGLIVKRLSEALKGNDILDHIGFVDPKKNNTEEKIEDAKKWVTNLLEKAQQ